MVDTSPDAFIQEVEEDLRQERYANIWKKYGNFVIGGALAIVLVVAGNQGFKAWDHNKRLEQGQAFTAAAILDRDGKFDEAEKAFAQLSNGGGGYAVLARLREAALQAKKGDAKGASAAYFELADDTSVSEVYRGLANILGALHGFDSLEPMAIQQRVAPLMADGNPWRHSAKELHALADWKAGKTEEARKQFIALTEGKDTTSGVRERAAEMVGLLGE